MTSPEELFSSPLEIIQSEDDSRASLEKKLPLLHVFNLLRGERFDLVEPYFLGHRFTPDLEEARIWFFARIAYLSQVEEYARAKQLLLDRLKTFTSDSGLYSALQYVMWKEYQGAQFVWNEGTEKKEKPKSEGKLDLLLFFRGLRESTPPDVGLKLGLWDKGVIELNDKGVGARWNSGEFSNHHKLGAEWGRKIHSSGRAPLEFLWMTGTSGGFELLIHQKEKLLRMSSPRVSGRGLRSLINWLNLSEEASFFPTIEEGDGREISSLYAASLLESGDPKDCLSYLSLNRGIHGVMLMDELGFPVATGEGTAPETLSKGQRILISFQDLAVQEFKETGEELRKKSVHSGEYFYQISRVGSYFLFVWGEETRYELFQGGISQSQKAIQKILFNYAEVSLPDFLDNQPGLQNWAQLEGNLQTCVKEWGKGSLAKITAPEFGEYLKKTSILLKIDEIRQCFLKVKNVIIFGHRSGENFFLGEFDSFSNLGQFVWEFSRPRLTRN